MSLNGSHHFRDLFLSFLDEVLASIQIQDLIRAVESPRGNSEVTLTMPIFKIEYRFNRTQELLQELGVNEIFVPGVGDFGNLSKNVRHPFAKLRPDMFKFNRGLSYRVSETHDDDVVTCSRSVRFYLTHAQCVFAEGARSLRECYHPESCHRSG